MQPMRVVPESVDTRVEGSIASAVATKPRSYGSRALFEAEAGARS
ncbi:MAG: hypothetical protein ACTS10_20350 [Kiloniellales bacterium]